jgi:Spy/CpxP family protein refolding chaperone
MRGLSKIVGLVVALTFILAIAGRAIPATAQTSGQDEVKELLQKIAAELNLSDDQKAKIKPILQGEVEELRGVKNDASLSPEQKQAKSKQIHEASKSKIGEILTPKQKEKWAAMKQEASEAP